MSENPKQVELSNVSRANDEQNGLTIVLLKQPLFGTIVDRVKEEEEEVQ